MKRRESEYNVQEERRTRSKSKRTIIWIVIALTILAIIATAVALVVVLRDQLTNNNQSTQPGFSYEDMFSSLYQYQGYDVFWHDDEIYSYKTTGGDVRSHNSKTTSTQNVITRASLSLYSATKTWVSPDRQFVLLAYDVVQQFRYSFLARYVAYRISDQRFFPLEPLGVGRLLSYMGWSASGHQLSFVYNNDVYLIPDPAVGSPIRFTSAGKPGVVFYGVPDWMNEEQILRSNNAIYWSKNNAYIAFGFWNDTFVRPSNRLHYNPGLSYASVHNIRYPKSGDTNPLNRVIVASSTNPANGFALSAPATYAGQFYFTNVNWATNNDVIITWMNRAQSSTTDVICNAVTRQCRTLSKTDITNGWVNPFYPDPKFSSDGSYYLQLQPRTVASSETYYHIAKIFTSNGTKVWITSGSFQVTEIYSLAEARNFVYFQSTEYSRVTRHIYSVTLDGTNVRTCISCNFKASSVCSYYSASFSAQASYYILNCLGPSIPKYYLVDAVANKSTVMEDNHVVSERLAKKDLASTTFYTFTSGGYDINVVEYRPPYFDITVKYPVIIYMDGTPDSSVVDTRFQLGFIQYLASSMNIIVARIDPRGTKGSQRNEFTYSVYRRLGFVQVLDIENYVTYLKTQGYVDTAKIAVYGWGYGGYLSAMTVGSGKAKVKLGIAGAPNTNWIFYDSVYSERYLSTYATNRQGYEEASVLNKISGFESSDFAIVHGSYDANVLFQNSANLINKLQSEDIKFRMQTYINQGHEITDNKTMHHMYRFITEEIVSSLGVQNPIP
ncbi:uncharacterized protein TRIADDRAFT_60461 [Trichoplax adhaerens]|uniref:Uncharacterized protein n=1 Tax=Trichoplax adhaerens TaxID=10228 RepID=B3S898_TRIAD|nr:hypothetical protein TRIADDRAFT_60461 [Trichoplax adhaerens]EDV21063.1 hypothetical protein TRIADDRAFT_60461 [Trichoplax adhaerens]|eukprot:XP_002116393.1 hypothetical protein TRIADDRAFT_60461 [Trichoplax adhaerens]